MRKMICFMLACLFCLQLAGCTAAPAVPGDSAGDGNAAQQPQEQTQQTEPIQQESQIPSQRDAYDDIIDRYTAAVAEGWDAAKMTENGLNYMIPGCLEQDERARVGYFRGDVNGDGKPELAIAAASESEYYTGMIFALYELDEFADGQPALLVESGERNRWYFAGEGRLYNEASDSAAKSSFSLCTADRELAYLDAVEYDAAQRPDDPWLRFNGETWAHISETEADAAMRVMKDTVVNLDITPFR